MMERFDGTNNSGIFRVAFQRKWCYMVTVPDTQAAYPSPLDIHWKERVLFIAKKCAYHTFNTSINSKSQFVVVFMARQ
jgi:hypothetical protein